MRRSLVSLLLLIAFWSLFYAGFKYFFWWVYEDSDFSPTLEWISWYVLLGSMIAYFIGWPLYARLSERFMLFFSITLAGIFFLWAVFLPAISSWFFSISMIWLGFSYSLYVIGKNTLIGREISTSSLSSSAVWALTTVVFIVFLIVGTIIWSKIWETQGLFIAGIFYFLWLLSIVLLDLFFADTRRERTPFHFSLDLFRKLFLRYGIFMIALGCFWQISVEASQVAINYSKDFFDKSNSASSLLLLFSSVGAILGNIISVRLSSKREQSFTILTTLFILVILSFSTILGLARTLDMYLIVQILAFVIGFFFWWAVNLAESHFFALLGKDESKDYTSALYGFVLSLVWAIMMFISEKILHTGSYLGMSVFLGLLAIIALYWGKKGINIKNQI